MGSVQIHLGKTRLRRRRALAHNEYAGVDPFGRPNFLYLTDSQRKRQLVEREFVERREGGVFAPEVSTVSAFLDGLWRRFGDGRAQWTVTAVAMVAHRLLTAAASRWPWFARLGTGPTVVAEITRAHRAWDEAGMPELAAPAELPGFLQELQATLRADPARVSSGDALRVLREAVIRPGPVLSGYLERPHSIVLDDILHPSRARRDVLIALAETWRSLGCHVVFSFETGRDLGGGEAGRFFEYEDADEVAFSLRPFAATRTFRRHLFRALVSEGGGAEMLVATADGHLLPADEGARAPIGEPPDVADQMYGPTAEPLGGALPRLVRARDREAEVEAIVRTAKKRILAGVPPHHLWIAVPGLPAYAPLLRRQFARAGVPLEISVGSPLAADPAVSRLLALFRLAAADFPPDDVLATFGSRWVGVLPRRAALKLARACRESGVTHGHPREWQRHLDPEVAGEEAAALAATVAMADLLAELEGGPSATAWARGIQALVAERVGERTPPVEAWLELVQATATDAIAAGWESIGTAALRAELEARTLGAAVPDRGFGGVAVQAVGMLELRGIHPPWLWIAGLLADTFPGSPSSGWLLSRESRQALELPEPADESRYLLCSALRNAAGESGAITLSWPETENGEPLAPSPLVEDLLQVRLPQGPEDSRRERLADRIEGPQEDVSRPVSARDLLHHVAEWRSAGGDVQSWAPYLPDPDRLEAIADILSARADTTAFGPFDGILREPPPIDSLPATALESWLGCPARFFYARVLALAPEEEWDADLDPGTRGTLLHEILKAFTEQVRQSSRPTLVAPEPERRTELALLLRDAAGTRIRADEAFQKLPQGLQHSWRTRWLAGLGTTEPRGILAAWLECEMSAPIPTTLVAEEQPFTDLQVGALKVRGRIDRVDADPTGAPLVLDYKTGSPPGVAAMRAGLCVQPWLYLRAVGGRGTGAAAWQSLKSPEEVRRSGWIGHPTSLDTLGVAPRSRVDLDSARHEEFDTYLDAATHRLREGVFHPTLAGEQAAGCAHCAFRHVCRADHERNAAIATLRDPRWHAPLGTQAPDNDEDAA